MTSRFHGRFFKRIALGLLLWSAFAFAAPDATLDALQKQLAVDAENNAIAAKRYEKLRQQMQEALIHTNAETLVNKDLEKVSALLRQAQINLDSINININNTDFKRSSLQHIVNEKRRDFHNYIVNAIKANDQPLDAAIQQYQDELDYDKALLAMEKQRLNILAVSQRTAAESVTLLKDWQNALLKYQQEKSQQVRNADLAKTLIDLQHERQEWLTKATKYNAELKTITDRGAQNDRWIALEADFFHAQENARIIDMEIQLAKIRNASQNLPLVDNEARSITELDDIAERVSELLDQLVTLKTSAQKKLSTLNSRLELTANDDVQNMLSSAARDNIKENLTKIIEKYEATLQQVINLEKAIRVYQQALRKTIGRVLSQQHGLPGFEWRAWTDLATNIASMPTLTGRAFYAMYKHFVFMLTRADWLRLSAMGVMVVLFWGLWKVGRRFLYKAIIGLKRRGKGIASNLVYLVCQLFYRLSTDIILLGGLLLLLFVSGFASRSLAIYAFLAIVWLVFRCAVVVARITLLEAEGDASGRDVKLYRTLRWAFWSGGIISVFTVLAHRLNLPYSTQEFFTWLFMIFLTFIAVVLLRYWRLYPELLSPYTKSAPVYVQRTIVLLSFLIPLTLLSNAVIGVLGFIDLSMAIGRYEFLFLLVLSLFMVFRGLWLDGSYFISNFLIRHVPHGWLWTQAFLKPMDRVIRLGLILGSLVFLFFLYGWGSQSIVTQRLYAIFTYPLFHITESPISIASFVELFLLLSVFFWAAKWIREFSYRWFFLNVNDVGMRTSLSIFCQYVVIIIGIFVTLKLLGIGLTGLTVIAGGMAVAIGFGLRDLANNFVSGLLLLFERPLRAGDLVSIGTFEGEVSSIGMRSITMSTWDHMEVFVPNSDVFSKPFTNWTLQDSIVRSVVSVKVNRQDNIEDVQYLIYQVLERLEVVLKQPAPQVFLKEIDDVLIEFEVRYYINLQVKPRAEVRSMVLVELWRCFDENGIQPPYPKQDIYVKELPGQKAPDAQKRHFLMQKKLQ